MNLYEDAYAPFNWTRFILLLMLLCVVVFYYSTQAFTVEASTTQGCSFYADEEMCRLL